MANSLDHLLWAVPRRAAGIGELERLTGVRAAIGGQHPGEGTHNALAGLGDDMYLEIIAPDPSLTEGGLARTIRHVKHPSLELWAARTSSAEATVRAADQAGLPARSVDMSRTTPTGEVLRWKLVWVDGHDFGPLVPFFIDWLDTPHPAPRAPQGLALSSFVVHTPRATQLGELFEALHVDQAVASGPRDRLVAEIASPQGLVVLEGPT